MRKREAGLVDADVPEEEKIQIEGSRTPSLCIAFAIAAPFYFDREQSLEQHLWRRLAAQFHDGIEIRPLHPGTDCIGLVDSRDRPNADVRKLGHGSHREAQAGFTISEVGTESNKDLNVLCH